MDTGKFNGGTEPRISLGKIRAFLERRGWSHKWNEKLPSAMVYRKRYHRVLVPTNYNSNTYDKCVDILITEVACSENLTKEDVKRIARA